MHASSFLNKIHDPTFYEEITSFIDLIFQHVSDILYFSISLTWFHKFSLTKELSLIKFPIRPFLQPKNESFFMGHTSKTFFTTFLYDLKIKQINETESLQIYLLYQLLLKTKLKWIFLKVVYFIF